MIYNKKTEAKNRTLTHHCILQYMYNVSTKFYTVELKYPTNACGIGHRITVGKITVHRVAPVCLATDSHPPHT